MGTSTDAELFYGYVWKVSVEDESTGTFMDAETDEEIDFYEWPNKVLEARGHEDPWDRPDVMNPRDPDQPYASRGLTEIGRVLVEEWRKLKADVEEEFGCEFFTHGGPEWRCPAIAVTRTRTSAWRGGPKAIDWEMMPPNRDWVGELDRWMAEVGITLDPETKGEEWDGPGWFLVSDWTH